MGHLVNPLLYRLNYSAFWNGSLITSSKFDSYINVFSVYFSNFVKGYFKNYDWVDKHFLFVSSLKFFFINKNIFVYVDFWHHANFYGKTKFAFKTTRYLFSIALKKRLLKVSNKFKNKTFLNYFSWKNYYVFRKHLTFFKKKIDYKFFAKNFLNTKTSFFKNNFSTAIYREKRINTKVVKSKFSINPYFWTNIQKWVSMRASFNKSEEEYCKKLSITYPLSVGLAYLDYCEAFSYKFSYPSAACFAKFVKIKSLPKIIDFSYWSLFLIYEFNVMKSGYGFMYMIIFMTMLIRKLYQPILDKWLRLKAIKDAKEKYIWMWGKAVFAAIHRVEWKKKVFLPNYLDFNLNLNFFKPANFTMLKKKKLQRYLHWARKTKYTFSSINRKSFLAFNTNFLKKTRLNRFKYLKKKRAPKRTFSLNKNWWKIVYSRSLKRKPYKRIRFYKKMLRVINHKRSFFSHFSLKPKKKFLPKLNKFTLFIKSRRVNNVILVEKKKKKNFKFKSYLKRKNVIFKVRTRSKKKIIRFYKNWLPKRYYRIKRWKKNRFVFTKRNLIRKFYFNKKFFFLKKKVPSENFLEWMDKTAAARVQKKKRWLKSLSHKIKKFGSPKAYFDSIKRKKFNDEIRLRIAKRSQINLIKRDKKYMYYDLFAEETMDLTERALDFWPPRRFKTFRVKKVTKIKFLKKKFKLLLKYFFVYNRLLTVKRNFFKHASIITGCYPKISVCFFVRAAYSFSINADLIGDFLVLWFMKKKFVIKEILGTLLNYLNKGYARKGIGGYAILMKGRFTRKDRAMYSWKKLGPMPLSHRISTVDYCNRWVPLKYSQCAFKIYLLKSDSGYIRKQHRNIRKKNALKPCVSVPKAANYEQQQKIESDERDKFWNKETIQGKPSYEETIKFARQFNSGPVDDWMKKRNAGSK